MIQTGVKLSVCIAVSVTLNNAMTVEKKHMKATPNTTDFVYTMDLPRTCFC